MEMWNGDVEWRCGMEMWNGDVEWRCGMEMWNGDVEWRCGMEMWNGDVEWRCGMEVWNGDLERRCNENWIKTCSVLVVKRSAIVGRSKNTVSAEIHFPKSDESHSRHPECSETGNIHLFNKTSNNSLTSDQVIPQGDIH